MNPAHARSRFASVASGGYGGWIGVLAAVTGGLLRCGRTSTMRTSRWRISSSSSSAGRGRDARSDSRWRDSPSPRSTGTSCRRTAPSPSRSRTTGLSSSPFSRPASSSRSCSSGRGTKPMRRARRGCASRSSRRCRTTCARHRRAIKALAHDLAATGDERAELIEAEADRLTALVSDLLDFSRINSGTMPLFIEAERSGGPARRGLNRSPARRSGRTINVGLDPANPLLFGRFDFTNTLRVLVNLLDNALKYSAPDTVIDLSVKRDGPWLSFAVSIAGSAWPTRGAKRSSTRFTGQRVWRRTPKAPDWACRSPAPAPRSRGARWNTRRATAAEACLPFRVPGHRRRRGDATLRPDSRKNSLYRRRRFV